MSDPAEEQPTGKRGEAASKADRERVAARGLSSLGQMSSAQPGPAPPTTTAGHGTVDRPIRSRSLATRPLRPRVRQLRRDGGSLRRGALRIDPLVWKKDGSARVKGPTTGPQSPVP
jgi:hypothetical protein